MKKVLLILIVLLLGRGNGTLERAQALYDEEQYVESLALYRRALVSFPAQSSQIHYNLGQCYQQLDSSEMAMQYFHLAAQGEVPQIKSRAQNQIGVRLANQQKLREALNSFKRALMEDPTNESARFNFEQIRRRIKEDPTTPPPNRQPPPPEPEEEEELLQDEASRSLIERLRQRLRPTPFRGDRALPRGMRDTISMDQAQRILEQMRENETQFLQQLRKRTVSVPKQGERPDW